MPAALMTTEMKAVLRDLRVLASQGVNIAMIQASPDGGVSVGIDGDVRSAEQLLRERYAFPVSCWEFD